MTGLPYMFEVDRLARSWGIPPWWIEECPPGVDPRLHLDWVIRGLELRRILEGPVERG